MNTYEDLSPRQRVAKFDEEYGPSVYDGTWIYHATGAHRDGNPLGPMYPPSEDPRERNRVRVRYYETLLGRAVRRFDDLKRLLTENAAAYPDHEGNVKRLKRLQRAVRHRQRQLAAAREDLRFATTGRTPEEERRYQQIVADNEARRRKHLAILDGMKV